MKNLLPMYTIVLVRYEMFVTQQVRMLLVYHVDQPLQKDINLQHRESTKQATLDNPVVGSILIGQHM